MVDKAVDTMVWSSAGIIIAIRTPNTIRRASAAVRTRWDGWGESEPWAVTSVMACKAPMVCVATIAGHWPRCMVVAGQSWRDMVALSPDDDQRPWRQDAVFPIKYISEVSRWQRPASSTTAWEPSTSKQTSCG